MSYDFLDEKATVSTRSEKEHVVVLHGHEIGTAKTHCDASFHANIINDALVAAYEQGVADRDNES